MFCPIILFCVQDKTFRVWDPRYMSKSLDVIKCTHAEVRSLKYSPNGKFLAVAEPHDTVNVYDTCFKRWDSAEFFHHYRFTYSGIATWSTILQFASWLTQETDIAHKPPKNSCRGSWTTKCLKVLLAYHCRATFKIGRNILGKHL